MAKVPLHLAIPVMYLLQWNNIEKSSYPSTCSNLPYNQRGIKTRTHRLAWLIDRLCYSEMNECNKSFTTKL